MMEERKNSSGCTNGENIIIHILVTLFGISAWIGVNGIFVQLPVLINTSPEGWNLPAYVVLVVQSANIGPLLYSLLQHFKCKVNESSWILCLLTLGTFAMGLLIFYYSERTVIAGNEHSLILFILIFFNALVGCFSSVLFMPYLRSFNEIYLVSYFIGEGLSGVLPSIIALIQGIDDNAKCSSFANSTNSLELDMNFPSRDYFLFIFVILFLSLNAFIILHNSAFIRKRRSYDNESDNIMSGESRIDNKLQNNVNSTSRNYYSIGNSMSEENIEIIKSPILSDGKYLSKRIRIYLFILLCIYCFFGNGVLPSIQSYSCLPYGNTAYKLSVTSAQFANPLACFMALWFMVSDIKVINYLTIVCIILGSYVNYLALMSPNPPLQELKAGIILVIISWTLLMGFISYLKLVIVSVLRSTATPKILFNAGVIMQIGSASGAVFSFIIINFTPYFKMYNNCASNGE